MTGTTEGPHGSHRIIQDQTDQEESAGQTRRRQTARAVAGGDAQGRLDFQGRCRAPHMGNGRAAFPGPDHQSSGARSARRPHHAGRGLDRPSGPDHVPLHRFRKALERSEAPAGLPQGCERQGPQRQTDLLADAGPCERAGRLVCRHQPPRPVPQRRRRRQLGAGFLGQRQSGFPGHLGRRSGRHAGRADAAFAQCRSARSQAPLFRHVERRRA